MSNTPGPACGRRRWLTDDGKSLELTNIAGNKFCRLGGYVADDVVLKLLRHTGSDTR